MIGKHALCSAVVGSLIVVGCESPPSDQGDRRSSPEIEPLVAQATPGADASIEVIARYGSEVVGAEELRQALERLPGRSLQVMNDQARRRFVENHVLNRLLFEEGKERGFDQDPVVRQQIEELERKLVVQKLVQELQQVPPITDQEIEAYYRENESSYSTTTLRARHILVRDEKLAAEILAEVEADPESFGELAEEHSIDTASSRKGGDLGFFGPGRMVAPFERAAFALQEPGDLSEVVKTQYGYHIILLDERREGPLRPLDQVSERIRASLRQQKVRIRTQDYYDRLKAEANLEIDEAAVARILEELPKTGGAGLSLSRDRTH